MKGAGCKVSVIILNWSEPAAAKKALDLAALHLNGVVTQFVIVENGSQEDVPPPILEPGDAFVRVRLPNNLGVSVGRNRGIAESEGEYIISLDDDAFVLNSFIPLLEYLDTNKRIGLAGPMLVGSDGAVKLSARLFPTLLDKFARRLQTERSLKMLALSELSHVDHSVPFTVDYVIGACQVLRREALSEVGVYDEKSFYGPEDVDLCLRMWAAEWSVAYIPFTSVIHDERRVTRRPGRLALRHLAALVRFFWKHEYLLDRGKLYGRLPLRGEHSETIPRSPLSKFPKK